MQHRHLVFVALFAPVPSHAEPADAPTPIVDRVRLSVETSPVLAAWDGYQLTVAIRLPAAPRWRFGASAFGLQIPETFATLDNSGWSVHDNGFAAGVDRELTGDGRGGWYVGADAVAQQRRTSRSDGTGTVIEYDVMLQAGYRWYPAHTLGATVTPWLGFPITLYRTAEPVIDGMTYKFKPVGVVPNIAVGWEF